MTESLHDRWTNLVEAIRQECADRGQHPDVLEHNESALKISLPIDMVTRFSVTLTREQVLGDGPTALAAHFYRAYIAERDAEEPAS